MGQHPWGGAVGQGPAGRTYPDESLHLRKGHTPEPAPGRRRLGCQARGTVAPSTSSEASGQRTHPWVTDTADRCGLDPAEEASGEHLLRASSAAQRHLHPRGAPEQAPTAAPGRPPGCAAPPHPPRPTADQGLHVLLFLLNQAPPARPAQTHAGSGPGVCCAGRESEGRTVDGVCGSRGGTGTWGEGHGGHGGEGTRGTWGGHGGHEWGRAVGRVWGLRRGEARSGRTARALQLGRAAAAWTAEAGPPPACPRAAQGAGAAWVRGPEGSERPSPLSSTSSAAGPSGHLRRRRHEYQRLRDGGRGCGVVSAGRPAGPQDGPQSPAPPRGPRAASPARAPPQPARSTGWFPGRTGRAEQGLRRTAQDG